MKMKTLTEIQRSINNLIDSIKTLIAGDYSTGIKSRIQEVLQQIVCIKDIDLDYADKKKLSKKLDKDILYELSLYNDNDLSTFINISTDVLNNIEDYDKLEKPVVEFKSKIRSIEKLLSTDTELLVPKLEEFLDEDQDDEQSVSDDIDEDWENSKYVLRSLLPSAKVTQKKCDALEKSMDVTTTHKFEIYCENIKHNTKFNLETTENQLMELQESIKNDFVGRKESQKITLLNLREYLKKTYTKDEEEIEYTDLVYKVRQIIKDWIPCLDEIINKSKKQMQELKKFDIDTLKIAKYKMFLLYLQILDNNIIQFQNESQKYYKPGFNEVKHKILYEDKDKNKKEKIINLKTEKKMWNIKINNKELKNTRKSNFVIGKDHGYIGDKSSGYVAINLTESNYKPYFSVKDVKQGSIGDCWLESTLKSMALKSPDKLLDLFPNYLKEISSVNGTLNGPNVTVRLYDYTKKRKSDSCLEYSAKKEINLSVDATELTNESGPAWNQGNVLWPHVIEKAVNHLIQDLHHDADNNYGYDIHGGQGTLATTILTGKNSKNIDVMSMRYDPDKLLEALSRALSASVAPTCATKNNFGLYIKGKEEKGLLLSGNRALFSQHVYVLKDVKKDQKEIYNSKITLINPWSEDKKINAINKDSKSKIPVIGGNEIIITLSEFKTYFSDIYTS